MLINRLALLLIKVGCIDRRQLVKHRLNRYAMMMLNYKTERELRNIVERAVNGDGALSRFARARLAVMHTDRKQDTVTQTPQPFIPDTRSAEEKIAEAKAMTRHVAR